MRACPGLGFDVKNLDEFEKRIAALGINFEAPSRLFLIALPRIEKGKNSAPR